MFVGFNVAFFPMQITGLLGMPRRIYTYPAGMGWDTINMAITIGAFVFAFGVLVSVVNFMVGSRRGAVAGKDPWHADTLEWSLASPPPPYGSVHIPTVVSRHPLWDEHEEEHDPSGERILDEQRLTITTSALDAVPVGLAKMPEDTISPLLVSLAVMAVFTALLLKAVWMAAAMALLMLLLIAAWLWPRQEQLA